MFVPHNETLAWLRWPGKQLKAVDIVLSNSTVVEETTLMRFQMKDKEKTEKDHLLSALEEECECKVHCRHKTMEEFCNGKCDDKVTQFAVEMVTSIYRVWCQAQEPEMAQIHKPVQSTSDVNHAFQLFSNGKITKEECMQSVINASSGS